MLDMLKFVHIFINEKPEIIRSDNSTLIKTEKSVDGNYCTSNVGADFCTIVFSVMV